jgi:hypothetical protein
MAIKSAYNHGPLMDVISVKTGKLVWHVTGRPGIRPTDTVRALEKRVNGGWRKVTLKAQFRTLTGFLRFLANRTALFDVQEARLGIVATLHGMIADPKPDPIAPPPRKVKPPEPPMEDHELSSDELATIYRLTGQYHCLQPARITMSKAVKRAMVPELAARVLAAFEAARAKQIANYRAIMRQDPLPDESLVRLVMMGQCKPEEIGL